MIHIMCVVTFKAGYYIETACDGLFVQKTDWSSCL